MEYLPLNFQIGVIDIFFCFLQRECRDFGFTSEKFQLLSKASRIHHGPFNRALKNPTFESFLSFHLPAVAVGIVVYQSVLFLKLHLQSIRAPTPSCVFFKPGQNSERHTFFLKASAIRSPSWYCLPNSNTHATRGMRQLRFQVPM